MNRKSFMIGVIVSSILIVGGCTSKTPEQEKVTKMKETTETTEKMETKKKKGRSELAKVLEKDYTRNQKILETLTGEDLKEYNVKKLSEKELYEVVRDRNNRIRQELYTQGFEKPIDLIVSDYNDAVDMLSVIEEKEIKKKDLTKLNTADAYKEFQVVMGKIMKYMSKALSTRMENNDGLALKMDIMRDYEDGVKLLSLITGEEMNAKDLDDMTTDESYKELQNIISKLVQALGKEGVKQENKIERSKEEIIKDYEDGLSLLSAIKGEMVKGKDLENMTLEESYAEFQEVMSDLVMALGKEGAKKEIEIEKSKEEIMRDYEDGLSLLSAIKGEMVKGKDLENMTLEESYAEFQEVMSDLVMALGKEGAKKEIEIEKSKEEIMRDYEDGLSLLSAIKGEMVKGKDLENMTLEESYAEFQEVMSDLVMALGKEGAKKEIEIEKSKEEIMRDYKDGLSLLSAIKGEMVKGKDLESMTLKESYAEFQEVMSDLVKALAQEGVKTEGEIEKSKEEIVKDYKDGLSLLSAIRGEKVEGKDLESMTLKESYAEFQDLMSEIIKELARIAVKNR